MHVLSKRESPSRGHLEISFQLEIQPDMQTPDNFCEPVLLPLPPRVPAPLPKSVALCMFSPLKLLYLIYMTGL